MFQSQDGILFQQSRHHDQVSCDVLGIRFVESQQISTHICVEIGGGDVDRQRRLVRTAGGSGAAGRWSLTASGRPATVPLLTGTTVTTESPVSAPPTTITAGGTISAGTAVTSWCAVAARSAVTVVHSSQSMPWSGRDVIE